MGFFKKLFSSPERAPAQKKSPDNTRLIFLLDVYSKNRSDENYKNVVTELTEGNGFLLIPTANQEHHHHGWETAKENTMISIASVYNLDGLKVLGAFTDERALVRWSKSVVQYTSISVKGVLEMSVKLDINRIVINSNSPDVFVVDRYHNTEERVLKQDIEVLIGTPAKPLNDAITNKLKLCFSEIDNIIEAYQYMQTIDKESAITIGVKLSRDTENARKAVLYALQKAMIDESIKTFVDMIFLGDDAFYENVKKVESALFYKRA